MPTQTSGPISFSDVQDNLGGSNPISLSEYYSADAGLPASGAISMSDMYARPRPTIPVISGVVFSPTSGATSYTATVNLSDSGANGDLLYIQLDSSAFPSATDSGWQTSNVFSQPADTVRYYRAMRYNPPYWAISGYWLRTAPSGGTLVTVTQANYNNAYYGKFISGSVSPTAVLGYNITYIFRNTGTFKFWVYLAGVVPDNAFSSVDVQTSAGTVKLYESAATTNQTGTSYRYWAWQQADFPSTQVYNEFVAAWDGTGDVTVRFYP